MAFLCVCCGWGQILSPWKTLTTDSDCDLPSHWAHILLLSRVHLKSLVIATSFNLANTKFILSLLFVCLDMPVSVCLVIQAWISLTPPSFSPLVFRLL